jgi:hypothetical protein
VPPRTKRPKAVDPRLLEVHAALKAQGAVTMCTMEELAQFSHWPVGVVRTLCRELLDRGGAKNLGPTLVKMLDGRLTVSTLMRAEKSWTP